MPNVIPDERKRDDLADDSVRFFTTDFFCNIVGIPGGVLVRRGFFVE